ncbi:MAG: peroxiredoxin [Deltaproteobacteria bacterium]|nr:peroxiredoxin [Deltaproteobacteria bacterium]
MKLQIGDKVPDFTTTAAFRDTDGRPQSSKWTLSEQVKKAPVLMVFYPGDNTRVCTKQLCDYRDNWASLSRFKVQIVGVSTNDKESHEKFAAEQNFQFPLLDDSSKEICRQLGMLMFGIGIAQRGFILVDAEMKARYVFKELLPVFKRTAAEVAEILKTHVN